MAIKKTTRVQNNFELTLDLSFFSKTPLLHLQVVVTPPSVSTAEEFVAAGLFITKIEGTASGFGFLVNLMPNRAAISVPGLKQSSSKCLLQRTEFSMGFHFARVRCTYFSHISLREGSLRKLKRLTPFRCVLAQVAAKQRIGIALELASHSSWHRAWVKVLSMTYMKQRPQ